MDGKFVDVWQGDLQPAAKNSVNLLDILSETERQKAETFRIPVMRQRYIAVRALLRQTLADYLPTQPNHLAFKTSTHGKPYLVCESLHFNISHTADRLMIAVANFTDIGIDIEVIKPRSSLDSIAARCFSMRELHDWQQLPIEHRPVAFYRLWTKKEAFVKAVGRGIALGLELCEVQLQAGGQLNGIPADFGVASDWWVTELGVTEQYAAALVTPAYHFKLRQLSLE